MARKKKVDADLMKQIKDLESQNKAQQVEEVVPEQKIHFDVWWMSASKRLDLRPYMKEILLADFKGRKLSLEETQEKFDEALKLFGL